MKEYLLYVLYCCLLTTQKAEKKWFSLTLVFNLSAVYLCVCVLGCLFFLKSRAQVYRDIVQGKEGFGRR